jgi:hypothetical protein
VAKKKTIPKPAPPDTRAIIVTLKGNPEFRDWLNRLADFDRSTAVQVAEKGMVCYANKVGFTEPAPKRTEVK